MSWGARELWEAKDPRVAESWLPSRGPTRAAEAVARGGAWDLEAGEIRFTEFYMSKPSSWAKRGPTGSELFILHKSRPSQAQCEIRAS